MPIYFALLTPRLPVRFPTQTAHFIAPLFAHLFLRIWQALHAGIFTQLNYRAFSTRSQGITSDYFVNRFGMVEALI